ncbi:uncharacterized protein J3R85_009518 [Psidium guajava]|nr:uncharacterized protein J3R85_009518 [Psidium guajava]
MTRWRQGLAVVGSPCDGQQRSTWAMVCGRLQPTEVSDGQWLARVGGGCQLAGGSEQWSMVGNSQGRQLAEVSSGR